MAIFTEPISETIWDIKYRYKLDGKAIDQSVPDTWHRVATAIAQAEKPAERKYWQREFYRILENFHFLPGGR
ncbi:ribonucleotide reductase N-terminal alpha domain-containing protein, partial [Escherichia coli]|uniref:ribonucleotide reductase N-terminal alpha domain-containing protein n=1 Tax=Escherichia coli TaxID=562 RepID=UPI003F47F5C5